MKASNKKLLSLLIVVAMVLVMTPVITLPASAATAPSAVQEWIDANADGFKEGGTLPTTCPFCGTLAEGVAWLGLSGTLTGQTSAMSDGRRTHIYLSGDVTMTDAASGSFASALQTTMCLYLNGKNLIHNGPYQVFTAGSYTMNIFGDGNVTNNSTSATSHMFYYNGAGQFNIYGGTYTASGSTTMFRDYTVTNGTHATVYGGTFSVKPDSSGFTNTKTITIPDGYEVVQDGSVWKVQAESMAGKKQAVDNWRTANASKFTSGTVSAPCPCCGLDTVNWLPLAPADAAPTSGHYYLTASGSNTTLSGANYTRTTGTLCLYLNNKELTVSGRFQVRGKANLIGDGALIRASGGGSAVAPLEVASAGNELNIYGGTYKSANSKPVLTVYSNGTLNIYDGNFEHTAGYAVIEDTVGTTYVGTVNINQATFTKHAAGHLETFGSLTVTGNAVVSADGNTHTWYPTYNEARTAAVNSNGTKAIKMFANGTLDLGGNSVYVDCNGKTVTVKNGTLYGFESTGGTGSYGVRDGSWVKGDNLIVTRDVRFGDNRYVTLDNGDGTATSYRYDLDVTSIALRTGNAGLYYKTTLKAASALANRIKAYGVVLSLDSMPYSDWEGNAKTMATCIEEAVTMDGNTATFTSGILSGIMKPANTAQTNQSNGEKEIYANAYLKFDFDADGDYLNEQYIMAVDADDTVVTTLKGVMKNINTNWDNYAPAEGSEIDHQATVGRFYTTWGMKDFGWSLDKIEAYVNPVNA